MRYARPSAQVDEGSILVQRKMRARYAIGAIFYQQMAQVTFTEHHDMVEEAVAGGEMPSRLRAPPAI
jgi:hypothetical protein